MLDFTSVSRSVSEMPAVSFAISGTPKSEKVSAGRAPSAVSRNARRSASAGSGTSMVATCGFPRSCSDTSASRESMSTNAMFWRFT
jgi:hypothetical protein